MAEYICPNCKQPIHDDEALLCHFCGESLRRGTNFSRWWIVLVSAVLILVFLILMLGVGRAQEQDSLSTNQVVSVMTKTLGLKLSQAKAISPIITKWLQKVYEIRQKNISLDEKKKRKLSLLDDIESELAHYLTKEQVTLWHTLMTTDHPQDEGNISPSVYGDEKLHAQNDGVLQSESNQSIQGGVY